MWRRSLPTRAQRAGWRSRDARGAPYPVLLGLGAGAGEYAARVRELLGDAGIDALMVCYVDRLDGDPEGVLDAISAVSSGRAAEAGCGIRRALRRPTAPEQRLRACRTTCSRSRVWLCSRARSNVAHGCRGRSACAPDYSDLDGSAARALISSVLDREPAGGWLSLRHAEALLATHGIPVAASHRCRDLERALAVALEIGGPVALKADFAAPARASEIDAVLLGLEGESAVRSGWRELERRVQTAGREWTGAIVQPLAAPASMCWSARSAIPIWAP